MQQALSSCTGFAPSPWPFLSGLFFFFLSLLFLSSPLMLFCLHFCPSQIQSHTLTARLQSSSSCCICCFFALFRCSCFVFSYLLLHFRYASCCAKWLFYVVGIFFLLIFLFFSRLWLLLFARFFPSCWYFHVFFLAQHAFLLAQNDLFHFLELTNTAKRGWNGNFVQISWKDDPTHTIRSRFTKSILWLNCKGVEPRRKKNLILKSLRKTSISTPAIVWSNGDRP